MSFAVRLLGFFALICMVSTSMAQQKRAIPHGQSKPPGPPLSAAEAMKKMTLPEGFSVELVASEPNIVNPVAMTFDERGRIWITESLEYPRLAPGKGKDRIKVLEDTDGDGAADKFTIFADGLNIPSGIAVGHGGVWVANSPDILFLQDTDGDGKADKRKVVISGFGRRDTHELPNSFTWGPDGYLYGLNGVFNHSDVKHQGKRHRFTCAMFRIHPKTHAFELFAEGTSNPWGIAFDSQGSAFVSACVIDHLWHLTETGYYHRQAGAYPRHAWKIGSVVKHKHQKAAYCGLEYFDSPAYPESYRGQLYMGNIHGNCINVDSLKRNGSTYASQGQPDLLSANDAWFMPVSQATGPDGCLYVLDWYDRYHCYQDARRDPKGIDRLKGRLYRIRYQNTPRAEPFDLSQDSNQALIQRLSDPNIYYRRVAQRLLAERADSSARSQLIELALAQQTPQKTALHAIWALISNGDLDDATNIKLLGHADASLRAWGVRAAGRAKAGAEVQSKLMEMAQHDTSPDVLLQLAIAAPKIDGFDSLGVLLDVLERGGKDPLIPHIAWANLHPLLAKQSARFLMLIGKRDLKKSPGLQAIMPRATAYILDIGSKE